MAAEYSFMHVAWLKDDEIKDLFERIKKEGLYESFFYNGQSKTADEFVKYARDRGTWMFIAMREGETVAFAALDSFSGQAAYFHHCHFRSGWRYTRETAAATLRWLSTELEGHVSTLIGITPASNKLAIKYARKCGFEIVGVLPRALDTLQGVDDAVLTKFNLEILR